MRTVTDSILTFGNILLWRFFIIVKRFLLSLWSLVMKRFLRSCTGEGMCTKAWWLPRNRLCVYNDWLHPKWPQKCRRAVKLQCNSNKTTFSRTERADNLLHMCSSNFIEQLSLSLSIPRSPRLSRKQMSYLLLLHFEVACGCWKPVGEYICIPLIFDHFVCLGLLSLISLAV